MVIEAGLLPERVDDLPSHIARQHYRLMRLRPHRPNLFARVSKRRRAPLVSEGPG
jgi:hypothetical protein